MVPPLLPFVAAQPLTDHHCHGVLRSGGDVEALLNEADGAAAGGGLAFDSLAGLAFRRWCPPLLDLPAHAPAGDYQARRDALGAAEVARRFLGECGLGALCMDTGYAPGGLLSPAETAGLAGAAAFEIVRLEQVAESLAAAGTGPAGFADAYRAALAERVASPASGVPVVGVKSIAAYRVGLALDGGGQPTRRWPPRPGAGSARVRPAGAPGRRRGWRTRRCTGSSSGAAPTSGCRSSFTSGYGDRDIDLHKCNPLLLTDLLRALDPAGVPVMLLHNYPYHREAGYLAQVFPHVYADLGLATHNVGSRAPAVLAEALEMAPLRKFLFSSDAFGLPELYYLGTLLFRQALSRFLQARLVVDDMSYADAERVTRLIATDNARRAYRLPG